MNNQKRYSRKKDDLTSSLTISFLVIPNEFDSVRFHIHVKVKGISEYVSHVGDSVEILIKYKVLKMYELKL